MGGGGRELPHNMRNATLCFQLTWRNKVNNKTWPLTGVSGVSQHGGKGQRCAVHTILLVGSLWLWLALSSFSVADAGERGGGCAQSCHYALSAGVETIRQLHWPAVSLPSACRQPAYTVYDTNAELFLLLLSCFPLRPTPSAASYLMMPPPLGCRATKSPRWQPFKPPSFEHWSHPDQQ